MTSEFLRILTLILSEFFKKYLNTEFFWNSLRVSIIILKVCISIQQFRWLLNSSRVTLISIRIVEFYKISIRIILKNLMTIEIAVALLVQQSVCFKIQMLCWFIFNVVVKLYNILFLVKNVVFMLYNIFFYFFFNATFEFSSKIAAPTTITPTATTDV